MAISELDSICRPSVFLMRLSTAMAALLLSLTTVASGQEFQPFPSPRVSEVQWQSYHYKVEQAHGTTVQRVPEQLVEIFRDSESDTLWVFTQLGHPAHPAWITRRTTGKGDSANVQQVGYFAGAEAPFAELFDLYLGRVVPAEGSKKKKK